MATFMKEKPLGITNYKYVLAAQATGVQQEIPNYFLSYKEKKLNYSRVKCYICHIMSNRDANMKLVSILLAFHSNYLAVVSFQRRAFYH